MSEARALQGGLHSGSLSHVFALYCEAQTGEMEDAVERRWALHCLTDWCAVALAGSREPLMQILGSTLSQQKDGPSSAVGQPGRYPSSEAALLNGTAGHALDYDDVNRNMHGHPTAVLMPAVLALGEEVCASGDNILSAFVAGYEMAAHLGRCMGNDHYDRGFHATATIGTVAASAACAILLKLDAKKAEMAIGLAATQAAGLKAMFGTMAKPLHAGKAAANAIFAAKLAAGGFTARHGAIECDQGFGPTLSDAFHSYAFEPGRGVDAQITSNLFKYHAACYLTHSTIEASRAIGMRAHIDPAQVRSIRIEVPQSHRSVCDIEEPKTGLDVKFSIRHLAGLALTGADTAAPTLYTQAAANDPVLVALRRTVEIVPSKDATGSGRYRARVVIEMQDGTTHVEQADAGVPASDIDHQEARLQQKARSLITPIVGKVGCDCVLEQLARFGEASDVSALMVSLNGQVKGTVA